MKVNKNYGNNKEFLIYNVKIKCISQRYQKIGQGKP